MFPLDPRAQCEGQPGLRARVLCGKDKERLCLHPGAALQQLIAGSDLLQLLGPGGFVLFGGDVAEQLIRRAWQPLEAWSTLKGWPLLYCLRAGYLTMPRAKAADCGSVPESLVVALLQALLSCEAAPPLFCRRWRLLLGCSRNCPLRLRRRRGSTSLSPTSPSVRFLTL